MSNSAQTYPIPPQVPELNPSYDPVEIPIQQPIEEPDGPMVPQPEVPQSNPPIYG